MNPPRRAGSVAPPAFDRQNTTRHIPFALRATRSSFRTFVSRHEAADPMPLRMTHRLLWHPLPKQRHIRLYALKSLAIRSEPVCVPHIGARPPSLLHRLASERPCHRVCRLVVQLFSHPKEWKRRRWQTPGPTGVLNPAPKDRSGRLWEPSLVSRLPDLSPHTAHQKLA